MAHIGVAFFALLALALFNAEHIRRWWRKSCDGCRIEDLSEGSWSSTPHTCSRRHSVYRDPSGDVWEFGRRTKRSGATNAK